MKNNIVIEKASDLVTSREQTRAGFIEAAMCKNYKAQPYIEQAKTLKSLASRAGRAEDLLCIPQIRNCLLTASGLSDKSLQYFTDDDKTEAIRKMISEFLSPAGDGFVDELVYRFLLIKGDSLGGTMRNFVGAVAMSKFLRKMLSVLSMQRITCRILFKEGKKANRWEEIDYESAFNRIDDICALWWNIDRHDETKGRILFFNTIIPLVKNNVDICLYHGNTEEYAIVDLVRHDDRAIMFGELKGGIDPAGADEHWKTGNSALERIRSAFRDYDVKTSFIAAAIEKKMAEEIYAQLSDGILSNAANITVDLQLSAYCDWLIKL